MCDKTDKYCTSWERQQPHYNNLQIACQSAPDKAMNKNTTDEEITALAREYAEETIGDILQFSPRPLPNSVEVLIRRDQKQTENIIRFLLRRFCLVEKSKVEQIYQAKQHILANQNVFGITVATEAAAQKRLMLCLFPEIGMEAEE